MSSLTRNLGDARNAFEDNDINKSIQAHNSPVDEEDRKEPHKEESGEFIKSIVFGGLDGIITTFAIVAAATGAGLTRGVILIVAFANLLGDAIGMAVGDYVSELAEEDQIKLEQSKLEKQIEENPEEQKLVLVELYEDKGFTNEQAKRIVELLFPYRKTVTSIMMMEEHGAVAEDEEDGGSKYGAIKSALVTFGSFLICGGIPLLSYLCSGHYNIPGDFDKIFIISIALFACVLFALGCFKGYVSNKNIPISGIQMLLNGAITTLVAFWIGYGIEKAQ
ncbi:hypothetical protein DICPUDRAFT_81525 [Dictyostelium purpureum]|uniref:Uncharacterized protein n=1 Tax=Dictyostelium purpureum TaxID=5786 RepID=F0ZTR6_DICPU|nr:uncharacterized protein DICPUDRAFT_81525 [Dictyostelium purpureum]EGC32641.1 hypothetical protein DICPUDRAFT_81525 [Dictyostelium purpureum]|eukprot:XP_003290810.1 hypothetical protein DICPUDRAFT_81525 [Dictyostelium purpureum]